MRRLSLFLVLLFPALALGGQTAVDKLITRLTGVPCTAFFDLDARVTLVETSVPANEVTYTPTVLTDWDGNADPGDLDDALNQLAERVDDVEGGASPTYVRRITVAVGAEVADHRTFTVTIKDSAGATVAGADTLRIGFYNDETTASLANSAVWPVADVGSGAIGTTLGGGSQLFMATTAAGVLQLDVNDIGGASSTTIWAYVEIRHDGTVGLTSAPVLVAVAFDGV